MQEALTNVFRHSGARKGWVVLKQKDGRVEVTIRDDGKGVDERIRDLWPGRTGVGISGMRGRAKELGGDFRITNGNPGTMVEAVIPCSRSVSQITRLMSS